MTFCIRGKELLMDLQKSDWLPIYDEEGIRQTLTEVLDLIGKMEAVISRRESLRSAGQDIEEAEMVELVYYTQCYRRNLRYLLTYFLHRLKKMRELRWETGTVLPEALRQETLCKRELLYFNEYNDALTTYNESVGFDLMSEALEPPRDLFVEIRVLKGCGEIMTERGPVTLDVGSTHYLKRTDIEHLIRLGHVEMFRS